MTTATRKRAASRPGGGSSAAERVQVAVRCRPFTPAESRASSRPVLAARINELLREVRVLQSAWPSLSASAPPPPPSLSTSASSAWHPPHSDLEFDNLPPSATRSYVYDRVFGPSATQAAVYDTLVRPIVSDSIAGYNCTIFAYGQTGAGKTYTMEGERHAHSGQSGSSRDDPLAGIIPRAIRHIFSELQARQRDIEFAVRCSYLELYNEQLTDLLATGSVAPPLRILQDPTRGTFVAGLEEVPVRNETEVFALLDKSCNRRHTAETQMNKFSSRSHAIFTVTVHVRESTAGGEDLLTVGKLNLVDLAGSENIGRSGASNDRAREAGSINQSLLTLGRVITALVDNHPHVPYRDSKLTRLLQESLGGHNKTAIIATIGPCASNLEETLSTLDYAYRAKNIQNRPTLNQMLMRKALIREYAEEIARLRLELEATRAKNGIYLPPELYAEMEEARVGHRDGMAALERQLQDRLQEKEVLQRLATEATQRVQQAEAQARAAAEQLIASEGQCRRWQQRVQQLTQERDEQRYLLQCRIDTEDKLSKEAMTLLNNLTHALGDLEALHGQVERQARQQRQLQERLAGMGTRMRAGTDGLRQRWRAWQAEMEQALQEIMGGEEEADDAAAEDVYPAAEAPRRRTWAYPKKLSRTRATEQLLATFRSAQAMSNVAAAGAPEDDDRGGGHDENEPMRAGVRARHTLPGVGVVAAERPTESHKSVSTTGSNRSASVLSQRQTLP
ncbi:hypothetical protein CDCA_CDCA20G4840 [Cyanidium caldarium]|uniref:Kinesin-like protein n=1 Tax=Cyanidium caldarium TaxID=2771 RepID=A0AAV9J3C4_CYACA|nr:hypothetical protein CDCA_CDCA20G4840 [Cyanidium caldarium]